MITIQNCRTRTGFRFLFGRSMNGIVVVVPFSSNSVFLNFLSWSIAQKERVSNVNSNRSVLRSFHLCPNAQFYSEKVGKTSKKCQLAIEGVFFFCFFSVESIFTHSQSEQMITIYERQPQCDETGLPACYAR